MGTLLKLTDGEGGEGLHELRGPGGTLRFTVGLPGRDRSAVWRVWANKNKSDVYVAARTLANRVKISLHESGDWRTQWTRAEIAERFAPEGQGRILQRWVRPADVGGWTIGVTIRVPEQDVVPFHGPDPGPGVVRIPKPAAGTAVAFHVLVVKPDLGGAQFEQAMPLDGFTLANGEVCLLVAQLETPTPERERWLDEQRVQIRAGAGIQLDGAYRKNRRAVVFGPDDNGNLGVWDLAVTAGNDQGPDTYHG